MSSWAIVAVPDQEDYIWKLSSEKVPHMTLLFLGEQDDEALAQHIAGYLEHVVDNSLYEFGMTVDKRGVLGEDDADVLFLEKDYAYRKMLEFRQNLLRDPRVFEAYSSTEQYPEWTPHVTMGYPETPAHEDDREYPGIRYINFSQIALWTEDYDGFVFDLENPWHEQLESPSYGGWSDESDEYLEHFGVKGMRWGVRRNDDGTVSGKPRAKSYSEDAQTAKDVAKKVKTSGLSSLSNKELQELNTRLNLEQQYTQLNQKTKNEGQKFAESILKDIGKDIVKSTAKDAAKAGINLGLKSAGVNYKIGKK